MHLKLFATANFLNQAMPLISALRILSKNINRYKRVINLVFSINVLKVGVGALNKIKLDYLIKKFGNFN